MKKILLVEDESAIADTLIYALAAEGFVVDWVTLGAEAVVEVEQGAIDLVILDVGLADISGFEVCKQIRLISQLPIIFLTARSEEIDRVVGLEIGGDDYVTKPFSPREVVARVKVILKRVTVDFSSRTKDQLNLATGIRRATSGCDFYLRDQLLGLTSIEFKLLDHLFCHPGRVYSREQLLAACGQPSDIGYERNIDSHIKSIRSKARQCDPEAKFIKTHRGFGYCYETGNPL